MQVVVIENLTHDAPVIGLSVERAERLRDALNCVLADARALREGEARKVTTADGARVSLRHSGDVE